MSSSQETESAPDPTAELTAQAPDRDEAAAQAPDRDEAAAQAPDRDEAAAQAEGGNEAPADRLPDDEELESSSAGLHKTIVLLVAVVVVAVALLAIFTTRKSPTLQPGKPVPGEDATLSMLEGVPQHGFALGEASAPLTLVELADLRCATCAQFAKHGLPELIESYVRTGELKLIFRPLDLNGPDSLKAARVATALAQQNRLWQFMGLMYHNQESTTKPFVTETYLAALVAAIPGADLAEALAARHSAHVNAEIARFAAVAQRRHLTDTPAFLLSRSGVEAQALPLKSTVNSSAFNATLEAMLQHR